MTIGVFDSGVGGLSVLKHLKQNLRNQSFQYIADSGHAPYGDKSESYIRQRSTEISNFLANNQVSAIVVACNTATAAAIQSIRDNLIIPVVAVEPGLKPASLQTKTGKVGVLATASTLKSLQYKSLASRFSKDVVFYEQAAYGLVELIEAGKLEDTSTYNLVREYLQPMLEKGVDSVVLGCTHYPFLLKVFRDVAGSEINIVDTGSAISDQLSRVISTAGSQQQKATDTDVFYSSGDIYHTQDMISRLLGVQVKVKTLPV